VDRFLQQPSLLVSLASAAVVVAALHFARPILMPLAIAILLSLALTPLVRQVERLRVGRVPAVAAVSLVVTLLLLSTAWIVMAQVSELAEELPQYRANLEANLGSLRASLGSAARQVKEIEDDINDAAQEPDDGREDAPKVEVVEPESGVVASLGSYLGSVAAPLGTIGLVVVMLVFLLVQREDLRDRLIRVIGRRDVVPATRAMEDAALRVSRYLRVHALLNAGHGAVIGIGLALIGLPIAFLLGMLSGLLRFVPYVGPWTAATLSIGLSVAVFDTWTPTLLVILLVVSVELVSNNVLEPWFYGASVGLSPFAVILSAVFWTWLWGGAGLVLATPLTVCLVVLGRHAPQLGFLSILLGNEPALEAPVRLYQRLLARDEDGAVALVRESVERSGAESTPDELLLPALAHLEQDRLRGGLDAEQLRRTRALVGRLVEILPECVPFAEGDRARRVLCLPTQAFGDELACSILARFLGARGLSARVVPREVLTAEMVELAASEERPTVCISAFSTSSAARVGHLCKRLSSRRADLDVVIAAFWGARDELEPIRERLEDLPTLQFATTLAEVWNLLEATRPAGVPRGGGERAAAGAAS
jgi:predicted PurR-regulated permease PerM